MRVYISGKITGLPYVEVERKFYAAERRLKERGYNLVWRFGWRLANAYLC